MSTKTKNLGLIKPELTDPANITTMNQNWDKIDAVLGVSYDPNRDVGESTKMDNWSEQLDNAGLYSCVVDYRPNTGTTDYRTYTLLLHYPRLTLSDIGGEPSFGIPVDIGMYTVGLYVDENFKCSIQHMRDGGLGPGDGGIPLYVRRFNRIL